MGCIGLEDARTDPGLVCVCAYDNTPLPGDRPPERCESCGGALHGGLC